MRWIAPLVALVVLAGCASHGSEPARQRSEAPVQGPWRFAAPPVVELVGKTAHVTFHVSRRLPGGPVPTAAVSIPGTTNDPLGMQPVDGFEDCVVEGVLEFRRGALTAAPNVQVGLSVRGRQSDTAVARVIRRQRSPDLDASARRAGCRPIPRYKRCPYLGDGSSLTSVEGDVTCARGRQVVGDVVDDIGYDACLDTCRLPQSDDYRCIATKNGEADWAITCRRGRRVVRGQFGE